MQKEAHHPPAALGEHRLSAPFCRLQLRTHHRRTCTLPQYSHMHPHSWVCCSSQATNNFWKEDGGDEPPSRLPWVPSKRATGLTAGHQGTLCSSFCLFIKAARGQPAAVQLPTVFMLSARASIPSPTSRTLEAQHVRIADTQPPEQRWQAAFYFSEVLGTASVPRDVTLLG